MRTEFEKKSLEKALRKLIEEGILKNEDQYDKLFDVYIKDARQFYEIKDEINSLRTNRTLLEDLLKRENKIIKEEKVDIDSKKEVKHEITKENIEDFVRPDTGRRYIKIHYPHPNNTVRIIENNSEKTGKELFDELQEVQKTISVDGNLNPTTIFEQYLAQKYHEVKMTNISEYSSFTNYQSLSGKNNGALQDKMSEKEVLYGVLKSIVDSLNVSEEFKKELTPKKIEEILKNMGKRVFVSLSENIIVTADETTVDKDDISMLTKDASKTPIKYVLKSIKETSISKDYETEQKEEQSEEEVKQDDGVSYLKKKKNKKEQEGFADKLWFFLFAGVSLAILLVLALYIIL